MGKDQAKMRYQALEECLEILEAMRRNFSTGGNGLTPREGYEQAWARETVNRVQIQEMMRELRTEIERKE